MWCARFARPATRSIALHNSSSPQLKRPRIARLGFVRAQLTTIRIKRSVSRCRAVSASAARRTAAVASSGAATQISRPQAHARTAAGPTRSITKIASETGSGTASACRGAKRCSNGHFPQAREARPAARPPLVYKAGQGSPEYVLARGRVSNFFGHHDALLSPYQR